MILDTTVCPIVFERKPGIGNITDAMCFTMTHIYMPPWTWDRLKYGVEDDDCVGETIWRRGNRLYWRAYRDWGKRQSREVVICHGAEQIGDVKRVCRIRPDSSLAHGKFVLRVACVGIRIYPHQLTDEAITCIDCLAR